MLGLLLKRQFWLVIRSVKMGRVDIRVVKKGQFWVVVTVVKKRQFWVVISVVKKRQFWVVISVVKKRVFGGY